MNVAPVHRQWARKAVVVILLLALLAPVFGWASEAVGYAEPIDVAAEKTGAADEAAGGHGLFPDYTVPSLSSGLGTLVSAVVGAGLTLAVSVGLGHLLHR